MRWTDANSCCGDLRRRRGARARAGRGRGVLLEAGAAGRLADRMKDDVQRVQVVVVPAGPRRRRRFCWRRSGAARRTAGVGYDR